MTVSELIEVLNNFPSDIEVEIDVDNGYCTYGIRYLDTGKSGMTKDEVVIIY